MKLLKTILQDYMPIVVPVIGCMELHDLQVEEYTGTRRGNHNSSRLLKDLKHSDKVEEHIECFNQVSKNLS